jgi:hypothetical protein
VKADAFIQFRVTPEVKALLRALAEREQISESALVRQLMETMLRTQVHAGRPNLEEMESVRRDSRLYVRLEVEDRMLLTSRAMARGMRSATYIAVLVRSHLRGVAPLPKEELLALKRSIAELNALGRNLNQMARDLRLNSRATAPGRHEVEAMLKIAEGLRDQFRDLLKANAKSWEQGRAETSH